MENCLVKKLKAEVNNDNMPVFGEIKFKVVSNTSADTNLIDLGVVSGKTIILSTTGNTTINTSSISSGSTIVKGQGYEGDYICVKYKYDILTLGSAEGSDNFVYNNLEVNSKDLKDMTQLTQLNLRSYNASVININDLLGLVNLTRLQLQSVQFTENVDIATMAPFINLAGTNYWTAFNFTGDLKDLLDIWATNGKEGTVALRLRKEVAYNGVRPSDSTTYNITFSNGSYTVTT